MDHVVSFSGGESSALLVKLVLSKQPAAEIVFCDTGAEHDLTYKFVRDFATNENVKIVCLRAVFSDAVGVGVTYREININQIGWDLSMFRDLMRVERPMSFNLPICTSRLKTKVFAKYCKNKYGKKFTAWLGMRADEPQRLKRPEIKWEEYLLKKNALGACAGKQHKQELKKPERPQYIARYLADIFPGDKEDVKAFWSAERYRLGILPHNGNCLFCVKKTPEKLVLAARDNPQKAAEWAKMLESNSVRVPASMLTPKDALYRGYMTLPKIIKVYAHLTYTELKARAYRGVSEPRLDCADCSVTGADF